MSPNRLFGRQSGLTGGILLSAAGNSIVPLSSLAIAPLLALGLGVDGRGELAAAIAPLSLVISIAAIGLPEALTYFVARNPALLKFVLQRSVVGLIAAGIAATLLVHFSADVLSGGDKELTALIRLATYIVVPALVLSGVRGVASGLREWRRIAIEKLISGLTRVAGILALFMAGELTPLTATICISATYAVGLPAYLGMRFRPDRHPVGVMPATPVTTSNLYAYGATVWFGSMSGIVLARIDQVLLTPLSSTFQLGLYAVAVNVSEVILIFNAAVREVVFSYESSSSAAERVAGSSRLSTIVTFGSALVLAALTPVMLPILFGEEFAGAVPIVLVLLAAIVLGNPGSIAGAGLSARGRPGLRSWSLAAACVVNIALVFLLVPSMGALGAAVATVLANLLSSNLNILWMRIHFGFRFSDFYLFRKRDFELIKSKLSLK